MTDQVHEQTIEAPPNDVWGFIIDPAALSVWFGADAWLDPTEGGQVRFRFADGTERRGTVEEITRTKRIRWRWREHRGAGFGLTLGPASQVTVDLEPLDDRSTLVRITESSPLATEPTAAA